MNIHSPRYMYSIYVHVQSSNLSQLLHWFLDTFVSSVNDIYSICFRCCNFFLNKASKPGEISCNWRYSHYRTLSYGGNNETNVHVHTVRDSRPSYIVYCTFVPGTNWISWLTLTWCVTPRLIIRGKYSKMTASNKLFIIHFKKRIGWWQELRVKHNLNKTHKNQF